MSVIATSPKPEVFDLLTDPSDAADLLQAIDLPHDDPIERPVSALQALLASHDTSRVFRALITFAGSFAHMAEDIREFFQQHQVSPNAHLRLTDTGSDLVFDSFQSSWAASLDSFGHEEAQDQCEALTSAVVCLLEQLRFEDFVRLDRASLGRRVRLATMVEERKKIMPVPSNSNDLAIEVCADGDYNAIKFATMATEEVLHDLSRRHLPSTLHAAFEEISTACSSLLRRMEASHMVRIDADLGVSTLSDEIYLCAMQARSLAARVAEAERSQEGLGDFLRSHFWRHRWRVYEIWLLTKTINILVKQGGEVCLHSVKNGVWHLPYGQSESPVATIQFGNRQLDIFYQYIDRSDGAADMPDILVRDRSGKVIFVIDPKHGTTYHRSKVQPVLARYHNHFRARLTAIVNYYPIKSYPFETATTPQHAWTLASNIAPGTNQEARIECQIAEIACGSGYFREARRVMPPRPKRWTPTSAAVIYWAGGAREVDEPKGAWCYTRERGAHPLARLRDLVDQQVEGVEATNDGSACGFRAMRQLILVSLKIEQLISVISFNQAIDCISWNRAGSVLLVKSGDELKFLNPSGAILRTFDTPTQYFEPVIAWIGTSGSLLYAHQVSLSRAVAYRISDDGRWERILDFEVIQFAAIDLAAIKSPGTEAVILHITPANRFLITATDIQELPLGQRVDISVSPSGRYALQVGPVSLRAADGISLLNISQITGDNSSLPLLRFIGELAGSVRWNVDESAFGFLAYRRFRSGADDVRISTAAIGDREAITISLPNQSPQGFAWVNSELLRELERV